MTASTTTRKSASHTARAERARASRGTAAAADQPKPQLAAVPNPAETPKPKPKPQPAPKPSATVDLGAKPVTYWFPSAKLSDGTTVKCPHARYGHESEQSAKRCIASLVAQHGHRAS